MQDSEEIQITCHHAVFVPPSQKELTCTILGNFLDSLCPEKKHLHSLKRTIGSENGWLVQMNFLLGPKGPMSGACAVESFRDVQNR